MKHSDFDCVAVAVSSPPGRSARGMIRATGDGLFDSLAEIVSGKAQQLLCNSDRGVACGRPAYALLIQDFCSVDVEEQRLAALYTKLHWRVVRRRLLVAIRLPGTLCTECCDNVLAGFGP